MNNYPSYFLLIVLICACNNPDTSTAIAEPPTLEKTLYLGADLSYVNEMLDCGGTYQSGGEKVNPYQLFSEKGTNLVRLRLWHNPEWTDYSTLEDVKKSIKAVKENKMKVLLDFHYSDDWADPGKQIIPLAWKDLAKQTNVLRDSLYNYTYHTLRTLHQDNLLPKIVQIGNEINSEILVEQPATERNQPIDWTRNNFLLNAGLKAVAQFNLDHDTDIETLIHIAQPENAFWWLEEATTNGLQNFDWIGLSYYPQWSTYALTEIDSAIATLIKSYQKKVMIVETAYPYTLNDHDTANNILGQNALIDPYPATPEGQRQYLVDLTKVVLQGGGSGVIYWEPAWISTACDTRWGKGSHWDNTTFFDASAGNEALPAFEFFNYAY